MTAIKICGLSRLTDINIANEVLPDYIGFVFAKSRRQVEESSAWGLRAKLNPKIQAVGVFVNDSIERIARVCNSGTIDIVQLHGDEDEAYIENLREKISNTIIKAVRVQNKEDIIIADQLNCDHLLLDAYREDQYGGCGKSFDWSIISKVSKPYFLAGGINSNNVLQAMEQAQPYCIDVSSGVETDDWKDRKKIIEIISKVRSVR